MTLTLTLALALALALALSLNLSLSLTRLRVGLERGDAADDGVELPVRDHRAACGGDGEEPGEAGEEEHEDRGHPHDAVALHAARRLVGVRVRLRLRLRLRVRVRVRVRFKARVGVRASPA